MCFNVLAFNTCLRASWLRTAADIRWIRNPLRARLQWIWRRLSWCLWASNQVRWNCAASWDKAVFRLGKLAVDLFKKDTYWNLLTFSWTQSCCTE